MPAPSYDLLVIGAGAAGSTIAFEARGRGARVALVERWKVGGTCLNAGCDPTKTLVRSAEALHLARAADRLGIRVAGAAADWPAVRARVEAVIDAIRGGDGERNIRDAGIDLYMEQARFVSPHVVAVGNRPLVADQVVVASGARPTVPAVPGLRAVGSITNVEAVALPALPRRLAILGGGVVACEFAQIFARLGVEVTMLSRGRPLRREEPALVERLLAVFRDESIRVEVGARLLRVERDGPVKLVHAERDGEPLTVAADEILLATGRAPVVDGLNLDAAGVAHDARGIVVDEQMRTTAPSVWAAGDVVADGYPFTHVADYQARVVVHNALSGARPMEVDYRAVPWAIFTDPELGRVGMTEAEATEAGYAAKTATVEARGLARAITSDQTAGAFHLVADAATGRLLGAHVLCAHAGELLGEAALAIRLRLSADAIAATLHPYPTFSEGVFWAAYELAKPGEDLAEGVRGVQTPPPEAAFGAPGGR